MGPKEAVQVAKRHVLELFEDEGISDVGLEEIETAGGYWKITIGFSRKWDLSVSSVLGGSGRAYKVLQINKKDGDVLSVKDRNLRETLI